MVKKVRNRFYDYNSGVLVIPTFHARIDKSKTPRTRHEGDPPEDDATDGTSKYFPKQTNSKEGAPIECTLLDEEAKAYGYKKRRKVYENPIARQKAIERWHSKKGRRLPFFTPATSLGLIGANRDLVADKDRRELTLREQLDRNILRMTRVSMSYACKQYPSVTSKNLLDKYAYLFGLKPTNR